MNDKIRQTDRFLETEIDRIEHEIAGSKSKNQIAILYRRVDELSEYYVRELGNFRHERLIHLLVTLFFAFLLVMSVLSVVIIPLAAGQDILLEILSIIVSLIILVLELFYVAHYFKLENGVQRLYRFSAKFHELKSNRLSD